MNRYVVVSNKDWQIQLLQQTLHLKNAEWYFICDKSELSKAKIATIQPQKIFFIHWSHKIDSSIFEGYECILFHMTDLPLGRGGSPLQNLIVRGFKETKISAIKVVEELDAGDIYLKKNLDLNGTAREIFQRATLTISNMILEIIDSNPVPFPQSGSIEIFKRRKPEDGDLKSITNETTIFDFIRMLDGEGYPRAFIETEFFKFEFENANLNTDKTITANVRITKK